MQSKNSGFTLIELSIVLVIIGLLTAGILIAQSLIKSAEINSFVRYISQSDIAVMSFKSKYNVLPGDSTLFGGSGNRNGIIEDSLYPTLTDYKYGAYFDEEVADFWKELSQSGFKPDNIIYSDNASAGIEIGFNIPAANIGTENTGIIPYTQDTSILHPIHSSFEEENKHYNWYFLADFSETVTEHWNTNSNGYNNSVSPRDSLAIDIKMDDGLPDFTGVVRAWSKGNVDDVCYSSVPPRVYQTNDNPECILLIAITPPIF